MEELVCNICHENIREGNEIGEINSCTHRFCFECIAKWVTIENSCPCCKVRITVLRKKQASCTPGRLANLPPNAPIPGKILGEERCEEVNQRPIFEDPSFEQWIQGVVCLVCGNAENEDRLLLCDDCDGASHTYCVGLESIPEGEWFCSSCTAHRDQAQHAQHRRAQQQQQAEDRARRRRQRNLIVSDDEDDDEVQIVEERPARRIINNAGGGGRSRAGAGIRNGGDGDLDGFIVSDSEDQGSSEYEEDEELGLQERLGRRRRLQNGTAGATGSTRTGRGVRQRQQRAIENSLLSDYEEEVDWAAFSQDDDDDEEDLDLDSPAAGRGGGGAADIGDGWRRAVRRANNANTINPTTRTRITKKAAKKPSKVSKKRKKRRNDDDDLDDLDKKFSPGIAARHAVEVLTDNWDEIRRGTTNFNQVLGKTTTTTNRRSRQGREAERARLASRAAAVEGTDVIDLSTSPEFLNGTSADAANRGHSNTGRVQQQQSTRPALSPPLGISLSSRLRAELQSCREKGARLLPQKKNNTNDASTSAAAANKNKNSTPDVQKYFAAADRAAALDTDTKKHKKNNSKSNGGNTDGSSLPSSSPHISSTPRASGSASWRMPHTAGSPGSNGPHRMRTVHDVHRGAEVARRTPTNGVNLHTNPPMPRPPPPWAARQPSLMTTNPRSSPAPLQQRLAARAAAEWGGTTTNGASGSRASAIINNNRNLPAPSPQWRQAKRHQNGNQQQQQRQILQNNGFSRAPREQAKMMLNRYNSADWFPKQNQQQDHEQQQQQQQKQQQQPQSAPTERVPLFLRNPTNSTNSAQQAIHSPSYSPSPAPRNNAVNNTTTGTTPPSVANAKNKKQQAYDVVRSHARLYYSEGAISREQYKKIARIATHKVYERHGGGPPDDVPSSQEAAVLVDDALVAVIRGEI